MHDGAAVLLLPRLVVVSLIISLKRCAFIRDIPDHQGCRSGAIHTCTGILALVVSKSPMIENYKGVFQ
jgi:hypothetical protein